MKKVYKSFEELREGCCNSSLKALVSSVFLAALFYSTVRRFAISFSVGVCYDLLCFIHKSGYKSIIVAYSLIVKPKLACPLNFKETIL